MDFGLGPWEAPRGYRVDHDRRRRASLDRPRPFPSSAPVGQDAKDLKYWDSWIPHPGIGLTPAALASALRLGELGYPQLQVDMIADLVQSDAHARNLFEHRERVVGHKPLVLNPGDSTAEAQTASNALSFAFSRLPIKFALEHLLRANRDGFAGIELDWDIVQIDGKRWIVPVCLTLVPSRRFRIGTQGMIPVSKYPDGTPTGETEIRFDELRLYQELKTPQGHPLRPGKWLTLRRQPSQVARGGLAVTAALYMLAKRLSWRDWIVLCERFGLPWPIVKYDSAYDDQATLDVARQIVRELGSDGGAAVSKEFAVDIVDGVKAKDPIQDRHIAFCNGELSKLVNGSTLRNDSNGAGSYGLGDVHDNVAWDEVRGDGELVSEAINQQIAVPFAVFNGIAVAPTATLMVEPDLGPVEFMSLAVKMKNELGGEVSLTQVRQRSGLRPPLNEADKAPGMQTDKFPTPAGGPP